jgi:prolyl-tRNA synthetase
MGDNMFRLKDRFGRDLCLGMTHEEVMTSIARGELRSYKQLPQIWYQIQTKFRDEPRPKSGLLRVRQFIMKDSYSFDIDAEGLDVSYPQTPRRLLKIFSRCGLTAIPVEAHSGAMGGSQSHASSWCLGRRRGLRRGLSRLPLRGQSREGRLPSSASASPIPMAIIRPKNSTPRTARPSRRSPSSPAARPPSQMKSLVMVADGKPVLALLRGDHQTERDQVCLGHERHGSSSRASRRNYRMVRRRPRFARTHRRQNMTILADHALEGRRNMIAGANKNDYHLRHVTPGRDFKPQFADLRQVSDGDPCAVCGAPLKLSTRPSKSGTSSSSAISIRSRWAARAGCQRFRDHAHHGLLRNRHRAHPVLGHRTEQRFEWHVLPASIAPFTVIVTPVNNGDTALREAAQKIVVECEAQGLDALYDDRDERPGVKFKDADLIGIPYRITIGKKLAQGLVELYNRKTRESRDVPATDVAIELKKAL